MIQIMEVASMTISRELGKRITALGFIGAAALTFLSGICSTIYSSNMLTSFWSFCSSVFSELAFVCLLAALLGLISRYVTTKDTMDLITTGALAASLLLMICYSAAAPSASLLAAASSLLSQFGIGGGGVSTSTGLVWKILSGICACGYLAIFALRAKNSNNLIMLIGLACVAFYLVLGDWIMDLIFVNGLEWYGFAIFIKAFFTAVCYGFTGVYVLTASEE